MPMLNMCGLPVYWHALPKDILVLVRHLWPLLAAGRCFLEAAPAPTTQAFPGVDASVCVDSRCIAAQGLQYHHMCR